MNEVSELKNIYYGDYVGDTCGICGNSFTVQQEYLTCTACNSKLQNGVWVKRIIPDDIFVPEMPMTDDILNNVIPIQPKLKEEPQIYERPTRSKLAIVKDEELVSPVGNIYIGPRQWKGICHKCGVEFIGLSHQVFCDLHKKKWKKSVVTSVE